MAAREGQRPARIQAGVGLEKINQTAPLPPGERCYVARVQSLQTAFQSAIGDQGTAVAWIPPHACCFAIIGCCGTTRCSGGITRRNVRSGKAGSSRAQSAELIPQYAGARATLTFDPSSPAPSTSRPGQPKATRSKTSIKLRAAVDRSLLVKPLVEECDFWSTCRRTSSGRGQRTRPSLSAPDLSVSRRSHAG
jgi:hypothetical protein